MIENAKEKIRDRRDTVRAEWKNLRTSKILLISFIVMMIVPILYGGFFLGSIWNPYGQTQNLPIAVVNQDQGAMLNGNFVRIGQQTVDNLKQNHDMKWEFVSDDEATEGINSGKYHMKMVIPKNFSEQIATVTTSAPKKGTITYTTTPSRNYIGSLLTTQAAQAVVQSVSEKVSVAYVGAVMTQVAALDDGLNQAATGAAQLGDGGNQLESGLVAYTDGVSQLEGGVDSLDSGMAKLASGSATLASGLNQLNNNLPTSSQINQLLSGVKSVQSGMNELNAKVQTNNPTITKLNTDIATQSTTLTTSLTQLGATLAPLDPTLCANYLSSSSVSFSKVECRLAVIKQKTEAGAVTTADITEATNDVVALQTRQATLLTQAGAAGAALKNDLTDLQKELQAQQSTLKSGVGELNAGVNTLSPNLLTALNGYTSLSSGASQLAAGATSLSSGASSAKVGTQQLLLGTQKISSNSTALISGATKIKDGSTQLATKLSSAAHQLSLQPTEDSTVQQIVSPVDADHKVQGEVENYGYALSPYVLSLGLFVGALAFNVIYPIRGFYNKPKNARSWWAAKMSVATLEAVGQALVLDAIMVFGLGLHPVHPAQFIGLTILTSLTFMSIIALLAIAMDNIGRFIAMLLLVLQLGSSEGVFPLSLTPAFFQAINPWVPMTYSIRAFREAISGSLGNAMFWQNVAILLVFLIVANLLLVLFLNRHGMRHFKHESTQA